GRGYLQNGCCQFSGFLDEIRLSDVALSPSSFLVAATGYGFSGFLQPINDPSIVASLPVSVFKAGSTVPVKFQLGDQSGSITQASSPPVWLTPQRGSPMSATVDESVYGDTASTGNVFRWDT